MSSNPGKVSFSFSKITKKPSLQVQPKETVKKVDKIEFIGSIENNSVKLINAEETEEKKPLVIPLQHPNLLIQSIIDTVKARGNSINEEKELIENSDNVKENGNDSSENSKKETLDEMAARELLTDADQLTKKPESNITVPLANQNYDKQESSLEDYENIPVNDFGLAMLRGMGWDPKKGIGKNGKIVKVEGPALRPKGLGLGADKALSSQKPVGKNVSEKDILGKGSKVRVTVGPYKNLYGTIEAFDDDAGRISVFMAISSERISMNECFVQLVTPEEFSKYSKVLNINAYNNYKEKCGDANTKVEESGKLVKKTKIPEMNKIIKKEHPSSSYGKPKKYYSSDDEKYSKKESSSSSKDKKSKKYDSDTDPDSSKNKKSSKSSSSKDKYSSKYNINKDEKDHRSKSGYESKHKKYVPESDSSDDEKYHKKHSSDSRKERDRSRNSSSSDDHERRRKHKKNKKKKHRSRSRSRR